MISIGIGLAALLFRRAWAHDVVAFQRRAFHIEYSERVLRLAAIVVGLIFIMSGIVDMVGAW